jgi:molybdenum cofactor cytidylyltransferase
MAENNVFAIVLAAGAGRRFGSLKQLQEFRGERLVTRAMRLAEGLCGRRSLLVTGSDWRAVFEASAPLEGFLVRNPDWRRGIGGSVAAGTRAVAQVADAVLLLLADQPLITRPHLEALVARWDGSSRRIVATGFADVTGPPVLFPARYFSSLAALEGDQGARSILAEASAAVRTVPFEPAAVDVDRPEDLARLE